MLPLYATAKAERSDSRSLVARAVSVEIQEQKAHTFLSHLTGKNPLNCAIFILFGAEETFSLRVSPILIAYGEYLGE